MSQQGWMTSRPLDLNTRPKPFKKSISTEINMPAKQCTLVIKQDLNGDNIEDKQIFRAVPLRANKVSFGMFRRLG